MTSARILPFTPRSHADREPVSPFRGVSGPRPLTTREVLHRRRMLYALTIARRLTVAIGASPHERGA